MLGCKVTLALLARVRKRRPNDLETAGARIAYCVDASQRNRKVRSWPSSRSNMAAQHDLIHSACRHGRGKSQLRHSEF